MPSIDNESNSEETKPTKSTAQGRSPRVDTNSPQSKNGSSKALTDRLISVTLVLSFGQLWSYQLRSNVLDLQETLRLLEAPYQREGRNSPAPELPLDWYFDKYRDTDFLQI